MFIQGKYIYLKHMGQIFSYVFVCFIWFWKPSEKDFYFTLMIQNVIHWKQEYFFITYLKE